MALQENFNRLQTRTAIPTLLRTATVNGSTIDTGGSTGAFGSVGFVHYLATAGITLDGTNNITLTLQDSDDGSAWANAAAADVLTNFTTVTPQSLLLNSNALTNRIWRQDYIGNKRYVRVIATFAGTHGTGTILGAIALLAHASLRAVTQQA